MGTSSQWPALCLDVQKRTLSGQITWLITACRWAITRGCTGSTTALTSAILSQIQLFWECGSMEECEWWCHQLWLNQIHTATAPVSAPFCVYRDLRHSDNYSGSKTQVLQGEGLACSYRWDWIVIVYNVTYEASFKIWITTVDKALEPVHGQYMVL